jgi:hypothetical protein
VQWERNDRYVLLLGLLINKSESVSYLSIERVEFNEAILPRLSRLCFVLGVQYLKFCHLRRHGDLFDFLRILKQHNFCQVCTRDTTTPRMRRRWTGGSMYHQWASRILRGFLTKIHTAKKSRSLNETRQRGNTNISKRKKSM